MSIFEELMEDYRRRRMRGLTYEELIEVTNFVQKHHRFNYVPEKDRVTQESYSIKYIDTCYDSRDGGEIWAITFRFGTAGIHFSSNHFTGLRPPPKGWKYNSLYDLSMAWLRGEFQPKEEFYIKEEAILTRPIKTALILDQRDDGTWVVKHKFTGQVQECRDKLQALEIIYNSQAYDT